MCVPRCCDRVHVRCANGGQQAGYDANDSQNAERDHHHLGRCTQNDVAPVVRSLVDVGIERHVRNHIRHRDSNSHHGGADDKGKGQTLQ